MSLQKVILGPGQYDAVDGLNTAGRYHLSKHNNAGSCVFSRSERKGLADKAKSFIPGPGQQYFVINIADLILSLADQNHSLIFRLYKQFIINISIALGSIRLKILNHLKYKFEY